MRPSVEKCRLMQPPISPEPRTGPACLAPSLARSLSCVSTDTERPRVEPSTGSGGTGEGGIITGRRMKQNGEDVAIRSAPPSATGDPRQPNEHGE